MRPSILINSLGFDSVSVRVATLPDVRKNLFDNMLPPALINISEEEKRSASVAIESEL